MFRAIMIVSLAVCAAPASAKERTLPNSPMLSALGNCQKIADPTARLACYDRSAGALLGAAQSGDITVVDKDSVRKARRSLFGFATSALSFLGSGDKDPMPARLDSKITRWTPLANGFYRMTIADEGAVWETTEAAQLRDAKSGEAIAITKGALGSFWAKIGKQREVRVRRIR